VPQHLESMGYRIQARPLDDPDRCKTPPQGMARRGIAGLSLWQHLAPKGLVELGTATPGQVLAALEQRFRARLAMRPPHAAAKRRFLQGLGQGGRRAQNAGGPKRGQGLQAPWARAFGGACLLQDRLTQTRGQRTRQYLHGTQQVDPSVWSIGADHIVPSLQGIIWSYTAALYVLQCQRHNALT